MPKIDREPPRRKPYTPEKTSPGQATYETVEKLRKAMHEQVGWSYSSAKITSLYQQLTRFGGLKSTPDATPEKSQKIQLKIVQQLETLLNLKQAIANQQQNQTEIKILAELDSMSLHLEIVIQELFIALESAVKNTALINEPIVLTPEMTTYIEALRPSPLTPDELTVTLLNIDIDLMFKLWNDLSRDIFRINHSVIHPAIKKSEFLINALSYNAVAILITLLEMSVLTLKKYQDHLDSLPEAFMWPARIRALLTYYEFSQANIRDLLTQDQLVGRTNTQATKTNLGAYFDEVWPLVPHVEYEPRSWFK